MISIGILIGGYIILERYLSCNYQDTKGDTHRDPQPTSVWNGSNKLIQTYTMKVKDLKDLGRLFKESKNHWTYAHSILEAASKGDPNAQYYLFKSIDFCNENLRFYFKKTGRFLTIDEGLQCCAKEFVAGNSANSI